MKIKASELTGAALDWAVAKCEKVEVQIFHGVCYYWLTPCKRDVFKPSADWAQGGSIIEQEGISILQAHDDYGKDSKGFCNNKRIPVWGAATGQRGTQTSYEGEHYSEPQYEVSESEVTYGPTPLIAAMRCLVASRLGDEVEIPEELK